MPILDCDDELFQRCVDTWTVDSQIWMAVEEISELVEQLGKTMKKINQFGRARIDREELVEEFVDTFLMMQQMRNINKVAFDKIYDEKVARIRKRLSKYD